MDCFSVHLTTRISQLNKFLDLLFIVMYIYANTLFNFGFFINRFFLTHLYVRERFRGKCGILS